MGWVGGWVGVGDGIGAVPWRAHPPQLSPCVPLPLPCHAATSVSLSATVQSELPALLARAARLAGGPAAAGAGPAPGETEGKGGWTAGGAFRATAAAASDNGGAGGGAMAGREEGRGAGAGERRGALALALTLGPPLVFTVANPGAFMGMLQVRSPALPHLRGVAVNTCARRLAHS